MFSITRNRESLDNAFYLYRAVWQQCLLPIQSSMAAMPSTYTEQCGSNAFYLYRAVWQESSGFFPLRQITYSVLGHTYVETVLTLVETRTTTPLQWPITVTEPLRHCSDLLPLLSSNVVRTVSLCAIKFMMIR